MKRISHVLRTRVCHWSGWKPEPDAAKNVREFIEKGGNADPAGDAIQDGDYHDLLDQNGGPEGF